MANAILITEMAGTPKQLCFRSAASFFPDNGVDMRDVTSANVTSVTITLGGVANGNGSSTGGRQSVKADLGSVRAERYNIRASFEWTAAPTLGNAVEVYWAESQSPTAISGNPGNISGVDASWSGYQSNIDSVTPQLGFMGYFVCVNSAIVQNALLGQYSPGERYGTLVINNKSGAAFKAADSNIHIVFDPIITQVQ
jgi:hypothetical protein